MPSWSRPWPRMPCSSSSSDSKPAFRPAYRSSAPTARRTWRPWCGSYAMATSWASLDPEEFVSDMDQKPVLLNVDASLATITLNRPQVLNAENLAWVEALDTVVQEISARPEVR